MPYCSIKWCGKNTRSSTKTDGVTFHRFPKDSRAKEKWITLTKRENWYPSNYSVVCSCHFTEDCFIKMKNRRRLLDTAIPTLSLPITADKADTSESESSNSIESNPDPLSLSPPSSKTSKIKNNNIQQNNRQIKPSFYVLTIDTSKTISATPQTNKEKIDAVQPDKQVDSPDKQSFSHTPKSTPDTIAKNRLCRRVIELSNKMVQKNKQLKNLREKVIYYKKLLAMAQRTRKKESDKLGKCVCYKKSVVPIRKL